MTGLVSPDGIDYAEALRIIMHWRTSPERLPEDFVGWEASNWKAGKGWDDANWKATSFEDRMPLVHKAILHRYPLPANFKLWDAIVSSESGWRTVAHVAATCGYVFPEGFAHWRLKNSAGEPVIHTLIRNFNVPPAHFSQWSIPNAELRTAAHAYLSQLKVPLPAAFDDWFLGDRYGITVAEAAIRMSVFTKNDAIGRLPEDRALWRFKIDGKTTLLHLRVQNGGSIPDIFTVDDWHLPDADGKSVIDLARRYNHGDLIAQYEALLLTTKVASKPHCARISRNSP